MNASAANPSQLESSDRLRLATGQNIRHVRHLFARTGYAKMATDTFPHQHRRDLGDNPPEHPLLKMFLWSQPASEDALRRLLSFAELRALVGSGMMDLEGGCALPLVKVVPYEDLLLTSDVEERAGQSTPDFVVGLSTSTLILATMTIRRPAQRALDVGTGSGIQAMLAARHSERVTAIDISRRALDFAHFNMRLNRIKNIDLVEGDLFEPVEGQTFDLVVSNPPYVISPDCRCLFRDNPMDGDGLLQHLVMQMPRFLNVSGYAQLISNWAEHRGQDWRTRLASWFRAGDCDVWAIRGQTSTPAQYATTWLKGYAVESPESEHMRWLTYFGERQIDAIHTGVITLRRSAGAEHWFRTSEAPSWMNRGAGDDVHHGFEPQDFLKSTSPLLDARLRLSSDVRLAHVTERKPSGWGPAQAEISRTRGLGSSLELNPELVPLLMRLDGGGRLRDVMTVKELANPHSVDIYLGEIRRLVCHGFLLPEANAAAVETSSTPQ